MIESAFEDGGASSDNFSSAPKAVSMVPLTVNDTNKQP